MASSKPVPRSRHRSSSDPFSDPIVVQTRQKTHQGPPPLPPKSSAKMSTAAATRAHRDNITEAVRETVTVRPVDQSPRTRAGRSQTTVQNAAPNPPRPPPAGRRSQSQDSVLVAAAALEKAKANGKTRTGKKGSMHADVIDRLDYTSVGPMLHHDGPFDACAPSRNRHRTKAPMLAWSADPNNDSGRYNTDSPYPSPEAFRDNFNSSYEPKKKVDVIAEAWGTHEPEPFEDFSAGGGSSRIDGDTPTSSVYNGREGHSTASSRNGTTHYPKRSKDGRDLREVYREYLDEGQQPRRGNKRSVLPPPQPIFVGDNQLESLEAIPPSPPAGSSGAPKRSKSLMQRIRKMRDSPNVPVSGDDAGDISPPSPSSGENAYPFTHQNGNRPTHRPQNSFLGRFGGGTRNPRDNVSPTSEKSENNFVYVEDGKNKELPATPGNGNARSPSAENTGYFDEFGTSPGGGGLGRKTSLLKKVRGVVRGNK